MAEGRMDSVMRGMCAIVSGKALALVTRSGSYSLMSLMLTPDRQSPHNNGDGVRWHPIMSLPAHDLREGFPQTAGIAVMVRGPVERFRSACARQNKTVEEGLGLRESDVHFWPIKDMGLIADNIVYFRFPDQINDCAAWLGLPVPVPQENEEPEEKKPVLTVEQEAAVRLAYDDDIALWESLQ